MAGTFVDILFFYVQDTDSIRIAVKLFTGFTGGIAMITVIYFIANSKDKYEEVEEIYIEKAEAKIKDFAEAKAQAYGAHNTKIAIRTLAILVPVLVLILAGCVCGIYGALSAMTNNLFVFIAYFILCVRMAYKTYVASYDQPPSN